MAQYLVTSPGLVNVFRKRSTLHDDEESCKVVDPAFVGATFTPGAQSGASLGDLGSAVCRGTPELISEIVRIRAHRL